MDIFHAIQWYVIKLIIMHTVNIENIINIKYHVKNSNEYWIDSFTHQSKANEVNQYIYRKNGY